MRLFIYIVFFTYVVFGQDTKVTQSADLSSKPNNAAVIGSLQPGVSVKKLKLDPSGKFVKVIEEALNK